jgi:transposase InsO family protein
VGNAFRQGFYWPTAVADATRIVRSCRGCQFYAKQTRLPAQTLQTIPITWLFVVWGLDLVGPLQKAPGGFSHLLVAIDKFSKWIEVRPLTSIRSEQAVVFFTNIIHRFGVPNSIITGNGTQFTRKKFLDFCDDHHIRVDWAAVAHPMTNGQVERANGMILQGLKPRIYNDLNKFGKR